MVSADFRWGATSCIVFPAFASGWAYVYRLWFVNHRTLIACLPPMRPCVLWYDRYYWTSMKTTTVCAQHWGCAWKQKIGKVVDFSTSVQAANDAQGRHSVGLDISSASQKREVWRYPFLGQCDIRQIRLCRSLLDIIMHVYVFFLLDHRQSAWWCVYVWWWCLYLF